MTVGLKRHDVCNMVVFDPRPFLDFRPLNVAKTTNMYLIDTQKISVGDSAVNQKIDCTVFFL